MVVFENFVEMLSKPCARHTRDVVWVWHTSKFYLIHTVTLLSALELAAVSKAMPTSKVSLWRASLVDSVACCPIDALACENCRLHVINFRRCLILQISQIFNRSRNYFNENLMLYGNITYHWYRWGYHFSTPMLALFLFCFCESFLKFGHSSLVLC